ncbi:MAG: hypothetical protein ABEK17_01330 [Candidatus Aenigmatarchaeota archaeon]
MESGGVLYNTKFNEIIKGGFETNELSKYMVAPTFRLFDYGTFITYSLNEDKIKGYDIAWEEIPVELSEEDRNIY